MTKEQYRVIYNWFCAHPRMWKCLRMIDKALPFLTALCYVYLVLSLALKAVALAVWQSSNVDTMHALYAAIVCPAVVYLLGTALRAILNCPRPYEQEGFVPLVVKKTKGKSFPSRHALSAAALSATWWAFSPLMGMLLAVCAAVVSALRVVSGVHRIRDVVCGLLFGGILGAVGMAYLLSHACWMDGFCSQNGSSLPYMLCLYLGAAHAW